MYVAFAHVRRFDQATQDDQLHNFNQRAIASSLNNQNERATFSRHYFANAFYVQTRESTL